MYTYIVPTIFKSDKLQTQLSEVLEHILITEVVLVINEGAIPSFEIPTKNPKLKVIHTNDSKFCNGAWNVGVEAAVGSNLILSTDDIKFSTKIFDLVTPQYSLSTTGVIGCGSHAISTQRKELTDITYNTHISRPYGFGQMMIINKSNLVKIPDQIKHWYGDDWIFYNCNLKGLTNYSICGDFWLETNLSESSGSEYVKQRIYLDTQWWEDNNHDFRKYFYK